MGLVTSSGLFLGSYPTDHARGEARGHSERPSIALNVVLWHLPLGKVIPTLLFTCTVVIASLKSTLVKSLSLRMAEVKWRPSPESCWVPQHNYTLHLDDVWCSSHSSDSRNCEGCSFSRMMSL